MHNWVHDNYISLEQPTSVINPEVLGTGPCGESKDLLTLGRSTTGPRLPHDDFNTVERNLVEYGSHNIFVSNSYHNVVMNNIGHNEPFITGCENYINSSIYSFNNNLGAVVNSMAIANSSTSKTVPTVGTDTSVIINPGPVCNGNTSGAGCGPVQVTSGVTQDWNDTYGSGGSYPGNAKSLVSGQIVSVVCNDGSCGGAGNNKVAFRGVLCPTSCTGHPSPYTNVGGVSTIWLHVTEVLGSGTYSKWFITQRNVPIYDHTKMFLGNTPAVGGSTYDYQYGHRGISIGDNHTDGCDSAPIVGYSGNCDRLNVAEGNRDGYTSTNPGNTGDGMYTIAMPGNIFRYNYGYGSFNSGVEFKWADTSVSSVVHKTGGIHNYVYNNTFYSNGTGMDTVYRGMGGAYSGQGIAQRKPKNSTTPSNGSNNTVINNLLYQDREGDICLVGLYGGVANNCSPDIVTDTVKNNWCTYSNATGSGGTPTGPCSSTKFGDPKFTNPDLTNPLSQNLFGKLMSPYAGDTNGTLSFTSTNLPDLSLQATSGAIDQGIALTTVTSGCNTAVLTLADAMFFQDGSAGSDLSRGVSVFPDVLAVGTVSNTATITLGGINYSTNQVTFTGSVSCTNGASVWLYAKADGARVLYGSAPDMGAYEYGAPTITFSLTSGVTWAYVGSTITLTWTTANATSCNINGIPATPASGGSLNWTLSSVGTQPFTLNCTGSGGSASSTPLNIRVDPTVGGGVK
jgi:hypothetical protein